MEIKKFKNICRKSGGKIEKPTLGRIACNLSKEGAFNSEIIISTISDTAIARTGISEVEIFNVQDINSIRRKIHIDGKDSLVTVNKNTGRVKFITSPLKGHFVEYMSYR